MHTHHHHEHSGHAHAPKTFGLAFAIGTALNLILVIAEFGFGWFANSLALLSDAAHNLSDVIGLLLAWGGAWLATLKPTTARTYGYRSASVLAALGNTAILFVVTGALLIEAVQRLLNPQPVESGIVVWVALLGIVVNTVTALLFMRGREHDLNIKGAFLHMAGDAGVSAGVVVSALVIGVTGWLWLDPLVSLAVAVFILVATWHLARDTLAMALDAVPPGIDQPAIEAYLRGLPGVAEVHDLHIWAMSTTETALTAHLVRPNATLDDRLLDQMAHDLEHRFGVHHATVQVEAGLVQCRLAPAHVV